MAAELSMHGSEKGDKFYVNFRPLLTEDCLIYYAIYDCQLTDEQKALATASAFFLYSSIKFPFSS